MLIFQVLIVFCAGSKSSKPVTVKNLSQLKGNDPSKEKIMAALWQFISVLETTDLMVLSKS